MLLIATAEDMKLFHHRKDCLAGYARSADVACRHSRLHVRAWNPKLNLQVIWAIVVMNNRAKPASPIQVQLEESCTDIFVRHVNELVEDSLKDVNGGLLPSKEEQKKHLQGLEHPGGRMFYWKSRPILFVSHPIFSPTPLGNIDMDVYDKRIYKDDSPLPPQLAGSN